MAKATQTHVAGMIIRQKEPTNLETPLDQVDSYLTPGQMATPVRGQSGADARDYFAEERTFLAWIRTGLASMGFGFVVARFGVYLAEIHGLSAPPDRFSLWSGTVFIAVGVAVNLLSTRRHLRVVEDLNRGQLADLRRPSQPAVVLALFLALAGVAMALYPAFAC